MAHFAKVENGKVVNVIVVKNEDCGGGDFPDSESVGQDFINGLGFDGEWIQTSYNRNFRGNFAGIGMSWNGSLFHNDSPFPSWILGDDGQWSAPIPMPSSEGKYYTWDEESKNWTEHDIL